MHTPGVSFAKQPRPSWEGPFPWTLAGGVASAGVTGDFVLFGELGRDSLRDLHGGGKYCSREIQLYLSYIG